jgi:hypothetical protein
MLQDVTPFRLQNPKMRQSTGKCRSVEVSRREGTIDRMATIGSSFTQYSYHEHVYRLQEASLESSSDSAHYTRHCYGTELPHLHITLTCFHALKIGPIFTLTWGGTMFPENGLMLIGVKLRPRTDLGGNSRSIQHSGGRGFLLHKAIVFRQVASLSTTATG